MENNQLFFKLDDNDLKDIVDMIKSFGALSDNSIYKFKFKEGINYTLSNNGLIATKTSGGNSWNCTIIGDKEIPKNKISKWKIKICKEKNKLIKCDDYLIGIGLKEISGNLYDKCWSLYSNSQSKVSLWLKNNGKNYNNHQETIKEGDIVEVIVDRVEGNLSFALNNVNFGIACTDIPKDEELYPTVILYEQGLSVELI